MGPLLYGKIAKIVIYDLERVNGGSIYEYPDQRLVLRLVLYKIYFDKTLKMYSMHVGNFMSLSIYHV